MPAAMAWTSSARRFVLFRNLGCRVARSGLRELFHAGSHGIDMVGPQVGNEQRRLEMQHVCTEVELLWEVMGDQGQSWPQARVLPMA